MTLYGLELVAAPATQPVTPTEAKLHARIDLTAEDDLVDQWIEAAREYAEAHCSRKFMEQTWRISYTNWPLCPEETTGLYAIRLPIEPVQSVTSVKYYDTNGTQQTLVANTDYQVWLTHSPPLIAPYPGTTWPTVQTDRLGAVEVVVVAGYASGSEPKRLREAIYLTLTYWSENRGDGRDPTELGLPAGAKRILDSLWSGTY